MIHISIRWTTARSALVVHGDTADSIVQAFFSQPQWSIALSAISFSLMTLIADYVTVSKIQIGFKGKQTLMICRSGGVGWFGVTIGNP